MRPLIGKLKWLGFLAPVLYIGVVDLICPLLHPTGPAHLRTHLLIFGAVVLGTGAFCFAVCHSLSSTSNAERKVTLLEEQQRLARDLHDDLAQLVASLHLNLASWEREVTPKADPGLNRRVKELRLSTESIYDKVREMICGRHCSGVPPKEGFFVALQACAQEFTVRTGIPIRTELPPDNPTSVPVPVATQLLRIIGEALSNVHRHSGAHEAVINAQVEGNDLIVTVADNGRGFDSRSTISPSSFGLKMMGERANLMDGSISVTTAPGEGTRITVRVPLGQEKPKWKDQFESWLLTTIPSSVEG